jgi:imidazolonepropionase-like amidohydrolase/Tol biopolymer transport system component
MSTLSMLLFASLPLWAQPDPDQAEGDESDAESGETDAEEDEEEDEDTWDVNAAFGPTHTVEISVNEGTWISVTIHGDTLAFDLLGDIWTMPISGGAATRITSGAAWDIEPAFSPDGQRIAYVSDQGGNEQIWLMNADGSDSEQFTDEDTARITEPVWDTTGPYIIARRRTVDTRSIGVTELYQYHLDGGAGFQLTYLDDDPHAGEPTIDGDRIWFSTRWGRFGYDQNPIDGIWQISRLDRRTGELRVVLRGSGSAARPVVTPARDGLVFVSRDREKTLLEHFDFASRTRRVVADWLDHDQMEGFAMHGVYPRMDWTENGDLVLWAKGKLWRLDLGGTRTEIPFSAQGSWDFHDVPRTAPEVADTVPIKVLRWPVWNRTGDVAFSAAGRLWVVGKDDKPHLVSKKGTGYAPAWSPDGGTLAWTSWSDAAHTGQLHLTGGRGRGGTQTLAVRGQLLNPAIGDGGTIAVLRAPGGGTSPNLGAEPWFELVLLEKRGGWREQILPITVGRGIGFRAPRLTIHEGRIYWLETGWAEDNEPAASVYVSVDLNGKDYREHMGFPGAVEATPSPDFSRIAYKLDHQAMVTAFPQWGDGVEVGDDVLPTYALTKVVGDWMGWTPDGQSITWAAGPVLHRFTIDGPGIPKADDDPEDGVDDPRHTERPIDLRLPRAVPKGTLALTHARVIPMTGDAIITDATVVIAGDKITSVAAGGPVPAGAKEIDCTGKTVIPGLIDVHAHLHYGAGDIHPEQPWQYLTALDFGVTTVQDPSASTDLVFTQAERVAAGLSVGPRVYSTGFVLYGALDNDAADTPDKESARRHVERLKAVGANSVKVYQQSQRERRQWYVKACNELEMLCVAEGGGDIWMNLSMAADGFQAIEHALPRAPLYADLRAFLAASHTEDSRGTAYSPTLLVAYGGLSGEHWFYQHRNPHDDARLLRHFPRRELDRNTWRTTLSAQDNDWNHQEVARDAAKMARDGLLVTVGGHGQLQGLGTHWELWALGGPGAMTPLEALTAATRGGAEYLGMAAILGTVSAGKLADLIVLNSDPLDDLYNTTDIAFVIANGTVWK